MRKVAVIVFLFLAGASVATDSHYGSASFSSGIERVSLLELYTSEGCSSCPPADQWLSRLNDDPRLWNKVIPIALHVDYWNYIGWDDRFSDSAYSHRQRLYINQGAARSVYTPGMFLDGKEWLDWRYGRSPQGSESIVGDLSLQMNGETVDVRFEPTQESSAELTVFVALLGMGLETEVRAGENAGRQLKHDFVALNVQASRMRTVGSTHEATVTLPKERQDTGELALVAWVATGGQQAPIQAVGGLLR